MRVRFPRLPDHQRAYALVERDDGVVERRDGGMAGPRLPHDIMHLVVERELRIGDGIWGGIAAGVDSASLRAELLADLVSSAAALDRMTAAEIRRLADVKLFVLPEVEVDPAVIASAARALQVEAARWARLRIGEELCYEWPASKRPDEVIDYGPVTLRRYRADDVDAIFRAVTDSADHLRPWAPWAADYTRASAQEFLAGADQGWDDDTVYNYAIMTGDVLVGGISLMARIGPGGLEIGYWVHQEHARRGLATAATAALVEQAFRLPGVDRLEIVHDELNVASGGVPRKLGFAQVERRPMDVPAPEGNGVGVVWRLVR